MSAANQHDIHYHHLAGLAWEKPKNVPPELRKLAEKSGLLKGDVILGINEHQAGENAFMNRIWVELADGPSTLQVLRGGREVQIEVEKMAASANA